MNCPSQGQTGPTESGVAAFQNCIAAEMTPRLFGYPGAALPDDTQYRIVALRNVPGSLKSAGPKEGAARLIEACLRARGILYAPSSGTCEAIVPTQGAALSGQIVGLSGHAASIGIGALGTAGTISGAATFGIGTAVTLAVSAIEGIFQHHAQAVANEQKTICSVANFYNPLMQEIDEAVRTGQISSDQGILYVRQVSNQAISGLKSILQQCNAACFYVGVLQGHIDFVNYYYPRVLSPSPVMGPQAPGSAPSTFGNPPGSVTDTGASAPLRSTLMNIYLPAGPGASGNVAPPLTPNANLPGVSAFDYLNLGYNQQTGQSGQAADVPTTVNWTLIGALAAVFIAFAALIAVLG